MLTTAYIISIISLFFIAVTDIKNRTIPDEWLWPLFLSGLCVFGDADGHVAAAVLGYAIGFALFAAAYKKQAMGFGDVKLLSAAGLWLGIDGLSIATVCACVIGVAYGLIRKQKAVPFAPFLFLGAAIYGLIKLL